MIPILKDYNMNPKQNLINLLQDMIKDLEQEREFYYNNIDEPLLFFPMSSLSRVENIEKYMDYCHKLLNCLNKSNTNQNCKIGKCYPK